MALATIGVGFLAAEPLYLIAGAAAYVVGWIFAPDSAVFRRYLDRKNEAAQQTAERGELAEFNARRDALIDGLSKSHRDRYFALADVCKDITGTTAAQADDPRIRKIEELMWTFLRLLTIEASLSTFLESEARDDVPALLASATEEVERLRAEFDQLKAGGDSAVLDTKERLLTSRTERLETLGKRAARLETAQANLALVVAEQERLDQQIKLIRADSIATRNAGAITARIDATDEHLETTNRWLSEMDQFRDLLTDLPITTQRAGFGESRSDQPIQPPTRPKQKT